MGKESATSRDLEDYVEKKETVFYLLINGKTDGNDMVRYVSVFKNDKKQLEKAGHYYMSTRDKQHKEIGSIFSAKIVFGNNAHSFVESILTVASYGKCFVEPSFSNVDGINVKELENIIIENVLPYYHRLIESELGMLYLRHKGKN